MSWTLSVFGDDAVIMWQGHNIVSVELTIQIPKQSICSSVHVSHDVSSLRCFWNFSAYQSTCCKSTFSQTVQFTLIHQSLCVCVCAALYVVLYSFLYNSIFFALFRLGWIFFFGFNAVVASFASPYANVSTEQQQTLRYCSTKSNNNNSSEQTTTDGLIFIFLSFLPPYRLANNIFKTNQFHTPTDRITATKRKWQRWKEREIFFVQWNLLTCNWIFGQNFRIDNRSSSPNEPFQKELYRGTQFFSHKTNSIALFVFLYIFCLKFYSSLYFWFGNSFTSRWKFTKFFIFRWL